MIPILIAVGVIGVAGLIFWPQIARFLGGHPAPTQPDEPDEREGHEDPVEHEGATEEWGAKLKSMRAMPAAPELISDTEMDLAWGLLWHDFEHSMQEEINRVFAPLLAAWPAEVHSFPAVMALVDGADKMPTGEWPRVVLV